MKTKTHWHTSEKMHAQCVTNLQLTVVKNDNGRQMLGVIQFSVQFSQSVQRKDLGGWMGHNIAHERILCHHFLGPQLETKTYPLPPSIAVQLEHWRTP